MTNQPQSLRGLKALVGIMAVLIVIGTTVVVGTVSYRLYARFNQPPTPTANIQASAPFEASTSTINLPATEHILGIASAGSGLAILIASSKGEEVLMLNPASGSLRTIIKSN